MIETLDKYLKYVTKDQNIVHCKGISEQKVIELLKDAERIRQEKKNKMKVNLLEAARKWPINSDLKPEIELRKLYYHIIMYHSERDYLPPTKSLLTQYAAYIVSKITPQDSMTLLQVYGIL